MDAENEIDVEEPENVQEITESEAFEIAPNIPADTTTPQLPATPAPALIEPGQAGAQFKILLGILVRGAAHIISGWLVSWKVLPDIYKGEFGDALAPILTVAVLSGGAYLWAWRRAVWNWVMIHTARKRPPDTPFEQLKQEVKATTNFTTPI